MNSNTTILEDSLQPASPGNRLSHFESVMLPNQSTVNRNMNTDTFWRQDTRINNVIQTTMNEETARKVLEFRVWLVTECQGEIENLDRKVTA